MSFRRLPIEAMYLRLPGRTGEMYFDLCHCIGCALLGRFGFSLLQRTFPSERMNSRWQDDTPFAPSHHPSAPFGSASQRVPANNGTGSGAGAINANSTAHPVAQNA